jgi:hypothetical protein
METNDKVEVGCHVEVELIDDRGQGEFLAFDIVPEQAADFDAGRLGENTPLAQAILGHSAGSHIPYALADVQSVRILSVQPARTQAPDDAAARRQASLQKALNAIARTDAAIFASSFSGKWGDYDPGGIEEWEK